MKKMRYLPLLLAALLLFAGCVKPGAVPAEAPDAADVELTAETSYTLALDYDAAAHTVGGSFAAEITNTSGDAWGELCFNDWPSTTDFARLPYGGVTEITNAAVTRGSGAETPVIRRGDVPSSVYFELDKMLGDGETLTLTFDFIVHIPETDDRFGFNGVSCNLGNFIPLLALWREGAWVVHPYYGNGESFAGECASFDVTLTADPALTVVCTGDSETENGVTRSSADNVRDFCAVIGRSWSMVEASENGVLVRSYYLNDRSAGRAALDAAVDALAAFGEAVGVYPYDTLDVVEVKFWAGGMEYPQLVMIDTSLYGSGILSFGYNDYLGIVVAHEVAHQWFYGVVGNDQYDEAWLDESFASFLEQVYTEYIGESSDYQRGIVAEPIGGTVSELGDSYYSSVYVAGCEFLSRLRETMGDEAFFAALHQIYDENAFETTDTETVLAVFRAHAAADIEPLITEFFG